MGYWEDDGRGREGQTREVSDGAGYEYKQYEVGKVYPEWKLDRDGYILEYGEIGFCLYALLAGVSNEERKQFDASKSFAVCVTTIADIAFFCFRFGNMPWADCPFSPSIYKDSGRTISYPLLDDKVGLALNVFLIDSSTGKLLHCRLIGLGHDFCVKWLEWARSVTNKPMSREEYSRRIDTVYQRYTTQDLVMGAEYHWKLK